MDDELDPYRIDATVEERTDHVIGVLLGDEDPVRRYRTVQSLQDGRLREVTAISLRQLRDQLGSTTAAAEAIGISRNAANELLDKAGAPGAREDRSARDQPAYAYGQYLAVVRSCAEALPASQETMAMKRWSSLEPRATQSLSLFPVVAETAQGWLKKLWHQAKHDAVAQAHRANLASRLDQLGSRISEWVTDRGGDLQLSIQEQSDVLIGYHTARVRLRDGQQRWAIENRTTAKRRAEDGEWHADEG